MNVKSNQIPSPSAEVPYVPYSVDYCSKCDCQRTHHVHVCDECQTVNQSTSSGKKKRAFRNTLFGIKKARILKQKLRFVTLTTSDVEFNSEKNQLLMAEKKSTLSDDIVKLKGRIKRCSPYKLYKSDYISYRQLKYYYGHDYLSKKLVMEYLKVNTNEGNGVIHIVYRGEYIPHSYLSDNWQDIHNSWDVNIKLIDDNKKSDIQISSYLVNQYICNQEKATYLRYSQTFNWIYRGYLNDWNELKFSCPPPLLYDIWDKILYQNIYPQYDYELTKIFI